MKSLFPSLGMVIASMSFALPSWSLDEATIQELQTNVSVTKTKTDDHDVKIRSLEGGLPAERAARIAADAALMNKISELQILPGQPGPAGPPGPQGPPGPALNVGTITGCITLNSKPLNGLIFIPGKSFMAKTDGNGGFALYHVPIGAQSIMIELPGKPPFSVGGCDLTTSGCILNKNLTCLPGEKQACGECPQIQRECTNEGDWQTCNCAYSCFSDPEFGTPCGVGQCAGGQMICAPDGRSVICSSDGQASIEICDGIDNDCDGDVDEWLDCGFR